MTDGAGRDGAGSDGAGGDGAETDGAGSNGDETDGAGTDRAETDGADSDTSGGGPRRVEVHPGKEAVVEFDPDLTFECVPECTWCCHHGVLLYEEDFVRLAEHASLNRSTKQIGGRDFVKREDKDRDEHVDVDGSACYFLREDGLCELHAEHDWKPTRCSVFPLDVRLDENDGEIHVGVRDAAWEHCEGMNVSERRVIDHLDAFLPELLWDLDDPDSSVEITLDRR